MASRYAFATLVTSDHYLPGALAVAAALKEVHPTPPADPEVPFQTVCIVTPETVDVKTIKHLRRAFDSVIGVEVIEEQTSAELQLLGRPDLHSVLTKLHVFRLTQFEKIIFLDADILPIRPLSHLFTLPHEFSAVPDVGWPDIFNSGMMVLSPGDDKFTDIMSLVKAKGSWDGGDQGVLNEWRGNNWNRLSFTYNTTPTAAYTYAPAYERFGSQISALHFIGPNKPWNELPYRAPSSASQSLQPPTQHSVRDAQTGHFSPEHPVLASQGQSSSPASVPPATAPAPLQSYAYNSLVDRWFDVYDRNYRQLVPATEQEYEARKYENAWDDNVGPSYETRQGRPEIVPGGGALGLEDLRRLAVEGGSSVTRHRGEGEYRSLPLEGRVDLMRPKRESPPKSPLPELRVGNETYPNFIPSEEHVRTPTEERPQWQGHSSPQRQHTMSPRPNEVPPSPFFTPLSLPPSTAASPNTATQTFASHHVGGQHLSSETHNQPSSGSAGPSDPRSGGWTVHPPGSDGSTSQPPNFSGSSPQSWPGSAPTPSLHTPSQSQPGNATHPPSQDQFDHGQSYQPQYHSSAPQQANQNEHHQPSPTSPAEPPRPHSPPLLSWNPAIEPPPNVPPTPSAFPTDAYFPNAWDMMPSSSSGKLNTALTGSTSSISSQFFELPPQGRIPPHLIQEGHYRNVMGQQQDNAPRPDISKVTSVFPWEQKPRHLPGRKFPEGEAAPPGVQYIENLPPAPAPEPEPSSELPTPEPTQQGQMPSPQIQMPSPPIGFPGARGYSNAWDSVPSIQKYASRLVKPTIPSPALTLPSPRVRRRSDSYRSRGEVSDASMDGDVEDEVDDDDSDADAGGRFSSSERSDNGKSKKGAKSGSISPSSATGRARSGKKEYRSYGVQTIPKDVRSVAVQVSQAISTSTGKPTGKHAPKPSGSTSSTARPHIDLPKQVAVQEMHLGPEQTALTTPSANVESFIRPTPGRQQQQGMPTGMLSPRLHDAYTFASPSRTPPNATPGTQSPVSRKPSESAKPPPLNMPQPPPIPYSVARTSSQETADSPIGPVSPADSPPAVHSKKSTGRKWNPATGVDVFKRSSEEVLARFLRLGSWEDDSHASPQAHG